MKKPFKYTKVGKFLKSKVFRTVADVAIGTFAPALKIGGGVLGGVIAGVSTGVRKEQEDNLLSATGGMGKPNIPRIIGYVILAILTALIIFDKIDENTFYMLWDMWVQNT